MRFRNLMHTGLVRPLLLSASLAACSGQDATSLEQRRSLEPSADSARIGTVAVALSSGGVLLSSLRFRVEDASGLPIYADVLPLSAPSAELVLEFDAPVADDYRITLTAEGPAGVTCTGSSEFNVAENATIEVSVALACEASGGVRVTGTITAPSQCPAVELTAPSAPALVGRALTLSAAANPNLPDISYAWASSSGTLASARSATASLTCTEAGPLTLTLTASREGCEDDVASIELQCQEATTPDSCTGLGSSCHVVDPGSGPLHDCHELGHAGDGAACAAGRAACVDACGDALCQTLGSLCHEVDPGSGPLHDCHQLGHAGDRVACFEGGRECFDLCTEARANRREALTLTFGAKVGSAAFRCGDTYDGVGSTAVRAEPRDLRFFVSDVRLIGAGGSEEPFEIEARAPWQLPGVALLDFADATGLCAEGTAGTNAVITGRVFPGQYTGIAFRVGVPEALNHSDPAQQPAPLDLGAMSWGWLLGYKFLVAEMAEAGADAGAGLGLLHLGSTACTGNPQAGSVVCSKPNRSEIRLNGFDAAANTVVADIGQLFAGSDLSQSSLCHSSGAPCTAPFASAGLDLATGLPAATQTLFRVE